MNTKIAAHFTCPYIGQPTNPVMVNLIGAGGNGSSMLSAIARINHALITLGHPGLQVTLFDDDRITEANLGRQLFAEAELGQHKAVALINRTNRFFGTNWNAVTGKFGPQVHQQFPASIYIGCVDSAASRFDIAHCLNIKSNQHAHRDSPRYWLDLGNGNHTGQVLLSTIGEIAQPSSDNFLPIGNLPFITTLYPDLLLASKDTNVPSCSLAEALIHQDLFINSTLANMGASLLWNLFRNGMTLYKGFFLDLHTFRTNPVKVDDHLAWGDLPVAA